jgi:hypothetical protein
MHARARGYAADIELTYRVRAVRTVFRELTGSVVTSDSDNFFDIGGNSLLVIEAIRKLREEWQVSVTAKSFLTDAQAGSIARSSSLVVDGDAGP